MSTEAWIALAAFLAGLIPYGVGLLTWYGGSREKKYAAKRDFEHLKNNQKEISNGIAFLGKEIDDHFDTLNRDILEIKIRLNIDTEKKHRKKDEEDL